MPPRLCDFPRLAGWSHGGRLDRGIGDHSVRDGVAVRSGGDAGYQHFYLKWKHFAETMLIPLLNGGIDQDISGECLSLAQQIVLKFPILTI